jgi:hypothetical protein
MVSVLAWMFSECPPAIRIRVPLAIVTSVTRAPLASSSPMTWSLV